jgi:fluoride ion exporter CrcB/FEX
MAGHLLTRRGFFVKYLGYSAALNLAWEFLQLPLYTLWYESAPSVIAFAVVHCTLGDVLIAFFTLLAALILAGASDWPHKRYWKVAILTGALGVAYTVFSEWNNTVMTRNWAYSSLMPTLWGIGCSPVAQWLVIPSIIFWTLQRQLPLRGKNASV